MRINNLPVEEALQSLVTSAQGLSEEEAARRLLEFGPNEIEEIRKTPAWLRLLRQFTHFLAALLWMAALLSLTFEFLNPGHGMLRLAIAIVVVIVVNAVFTFMQEYRAEKSLEAMRRLLPFDVKALRDGSEKRMSAEGVVPGDVIVLSEGDRVPADSRLIEAVGLRVNNALLTGEAEAVSLLAGPHDGLSLMESPNIVFAGSTVIGGSGRAAVFATGMRTEFGKIARLTGSVTAEPSPLQREIVKTTRIVGTMAVVMGVVFFTAGHLVGRTFMENFLFAVGIIVANVPEGLLPTVTLSLAMGAKRMAGRNALVKTLTSVETLGSVNVICTDKTGTLTRNKMAVGKTIDFGVGGQPQDKYGPSLYEIALLCNNAKESEGRITGEPTETALYEAALKSAGKVQSRRLKEFPFDPELKRMGTVNEIGGKTYVLVKGAPEGLFPLCSRILLGGAAADFDGENRKKALSAYNEMTEGGLRALAFAYREGGQDGLGREEAEQGLVLSGLIGLEDPPRPEVKEAISRCGEAGIKIIMITGDGSRTAAAIAREIGLLSGPREAAVVEGEELSGLSDAALREAVSRPEVIFARMSPKQKLRVVGILKDEGLRVAVTGDGVNDAPALRRADIGVAMGSGTDVAKEAADIILLDDNFATIVNAVEEGRAVYENIRKFMSYIFSSNIPEIVPYIAYVLFPIPLPLTIMQILAVDLGTDMLPALALGAEKPTAALMKSPPREPRQRLLSLPLLARAYLFLGPIEAAAGLFGFFFVLNAGGWSYGEWMPPAEPLYLTATTACLAAIIITQAANIFACRSWRESVFSLGFFSNRLLFAGIAAEFALLLFIVYHPFGNMVFSTHPVPAALWLALIPFALFLFAAEETRKLIARRL